MTCEVCGFWIQPEWDGTFPDVCPDCEESPATGCGDSECGQHEGHCLLEEPRYRPETCSYCKEG